MKVIISDFWKRKRDSHPHTSSLPRPRQRTRQYALNIMAPKTSHFTFCSSQTLLQHPRLIVMNKEEEYFLSHRPFFYLK